MKVVTSPFRRAEENLAFEQELLGRGEFCLFTHRDAPCVSIGCNQDLESEVDVALARQLGIDIVRRQTGGGAVFRDEGCVAFSLVIPASSLADAMMIPERALQSLGVPVVRNGRNDLYVGDRKVCGCAWQDAGERVLFHGSVLFDVDLALMERLLAPGKRKYHGTALRSVRARVANIAPLLPGMDAAVFQQRLEEALLGELGGQVPLLTCP